ncbi:1-phosphatidylinositol phosphodiesterase, partial [Bacillus thuringiensis]|nr:1-phosphatidylinositol phosphodiesterase [Bacillus thuringiensis]
ERINRTDFPHSEWNDRVSSILLHTRTEIPIYEYSNFTGNSVKLTNLTHLPQLFDFISNNYNKKILSCERKAI